MRFRLKEILECILVALVLVGAYSASLASRVVIRAEASVDYERQQQSLNKGKPVRYHFVEGKFFKGISNDKSLVGVSFLK